MLRYWRQLCVPMYAKCVPHVWKRFLFSWWIFLFLTQVMLQGLLEGSEDPEMGSKGVVVCHSEPGAWNPPLFETSLCPPLGYAAKGVYTVGRTMFETDRLLPEHVKRCNQMDEVGLTTARAAEPPFLPWQNLRCFHPYPCTPASGALFIH